MVGEHATSCHEKEGGGYGVNTYPVNTPIDSGKAVVA
jgi:hypothetical protein